MRRRRMLKLALVVACVVACLGCATRAGPFVRSIEKSGDTGEVTVERCYVKFNPWIWIGVVETTDCTTSKERL
jgi:hypothetical protein